MFDNLDKAFSTESDIIPVEHKTSEIEVINKNETEDIKKD